MYTESTVRTNKLYCSDCDEKIHKGDTCVFDLSEETDRMVNVYCEHCSQYYQDEVLNDMEHPFDTASLGQD